MVCDFSTVFGWAFDILQVSINLADVATDWAILHQWHQEGEESRVFFGLLLAIVLLSSIISSGALIIRLEDHLPCGRPHEWYNYLGYGALFLPVAPLGGLINFVASHVWDDLDDFEDKEVDWAGASPSLNKKGGGKDGGGAAAANNNSNSMKKLPQQHQHAEEEQEGAAAMEISKDLEGSFRALKELDQAVLKRLGAYMLLGLSAASESIPSAVVQLIYISIKSGEISTLSLVSLLLSLGSIAFKSFLVARSFERKAVIAKSACIFFDVFALAYLFSSLFNAADPKDTTLFGSSVAVTHLTYAYIVVKLISLTCCLVAFFILLVRVIQDSDGCDEWCGRPLAMFFALVVCGVPALVVQETLKLSWLISMATSLEPNYNVFPWAGYMHEFLHHGSGPARRAATDWQATLRAVLGKLEAQMDEMERLVERATKEDEDDGDKKKKKNKESDSDDDDGGASGGGLPFSHQQFRAARRHHAPKKSPMAAGSRRFIHPSFTGEDVALRWDQRLPSFQQPLAGEAIVYEDNFITRATHFECLFAFEQASNKLADVSRSVNQIVRRNPSPAALARAWPPLQSRLKVHRTAVESDVHTNMFLSPHAPNRLEVRDVMHDDFSEFSWEKCSETCAKFWCCECTSDCGEIGEMTAAGLVALSCVLSSLMGIVFPIAHASLYLWQQSLVGRISFIASMASLFVIVVLLPSVWRYVRTCRIINRSPAISAFLKKQILSAIDVYFSLPMLLVAKSVESESLPEDALAAHVLPFLDSRAVHLWGLGAADFDKMMSVWKSSATTGAAAAAVAAAEAETIVAVPDESVVTSGEGEEAEMIGIPYTASE